MAARTTRSARTRRTPTKASAPEAPAAVTGAGDFLARTRALHDLLASLWREPAREAPRRAIHDAWRTHLAPRRSTLEAALQGLRSARTWLLDADDHAVALAPAAWATQPRALARLYATVAGARDGYARARIRWQEPTRMGMHAVRQAPIVRVGEHAKERERQSKEAAELRKRLAERHGQALADVLKDWHARQAGLQQALDLLRDLVVDLCAAEERRLSSAAATAASTLQALRHARIDLAHLTGTPASRFGSLLDRWLAARARVAAVPR